jgi:hypothetical protein
LESLRRGDPCGGDIILGVGSIAVAPDGGAMSQVWDYLNTLKPGDTVSRSEAGGFAVRLFVDREAFVEFEQQSRLVCIVSHRG